LTLGYLALGYIKAESKQKPALSAVDKACDRNIQPLVNQFDTHDSYHCYQVRCIEKKMSSISTFD
jgi:hypothetical protein